MGSHSSKTSRQSGIRGLAEELALSLGTVSRALNNHPNVRPQTRQRVLKAAAKRGYMPDPQARALRTRKTNRLGLLLPTLTNPNYVEKVANAQRAAWERGYDVTFACTEWAPEHEESILQHLISQGVDGLILTLSVAQLADTHPLHLAQKRNIPVVLLSSIAVHWPNCSSICVDTKLGGYLAMRHLLELGHRRVGLLGMDTHPSQHTARLQGLQQALQEYHLDWAICQPIDAVSGTMESGYEAAARMVTQRSAPPPTAFLCVDDQVAIGAIAALKDHQWRVPDDISVIGYDNTINAQFCRPTLTTISQTHLDIGRQAVEMLLERIDDPDIPPRHHCLRPTFVLGQSTGPSAVSTSSHR